MGPITMQPVADKYIRLALEEGISSEDVSTNSVMPEYRKGEVQFICKEDDIIAGLQVFEHVFTLLDPETRVVPNTRDGEEAKKGQRLATVTGDVRVLLPGERTALNYPQRLSGIATYTYTVAGMLEGTETRFLDTRRTTPCMRISKKYAVRVGGEQNHCYSLSNGIFLEDNHIDAVGDVREAVVAAKAYALFVHRIGVETESLDMVKEAMDTDVGIIMLNNMVPEQVAETVRYIDGQAETECSGNTTKGDIRTITELGMDYVSSNTLTHSSPIPNISPKHLKVLTD